MIWLLPAAFAGIAFETPPTEGQETVVIVVAGTPGGDLAEDRQPVGGATLRVVHRPGLPGEHEQAIGITDGRGRARWVPSEGGVAEVRANDEAVPVRITPARPPTTTLALLAAIGLGGVGALGYGLGRRRS